LFRHLEASLYEKEVQTNDQEMEENYGTIWAPGKIIGYKIFRRNNYWPGSCKG